MRPTLCLLATAVLAAAEPGITLEIAPGADLRAGWASGPYARVLGDRALMGTIGATVADLARRGAPLLDTTGARMEGDTRGIRWTIECPTPEAARRWVAAVADLRGAIDPDLPAGPVVPRADGRRVIAQSGDAAPRPPLVRTHHVEFAADLPALPGMPGRVTGWADLVPAGSRDRVDAAWPGLAAALRPADPQAVAALPTGTLLAAAVAVDGSAAMRWLATVAGDAAPRWDAAVRAGGLGTSLADLAPLITGTWTMAVLPGAPFPELIVSAPRDPAQDGRIMGLLERIPGWSAEGDGPWMTPIPDSPVMLTVAREPARWRFHIGGAGTAPTPGGLTIPATAAIWIAVDLPRVAQAAAGWAALASRDRQVQAQVRAAAGAIRLLGPQTFALARVGDDRVRLEAQGPMGLLAAPTLATLALPAIGRVREQADRAKTANNAKQIVVCLIAYATDNDGRLPADLAELIPWSQGDVTERIFRSAAGDRLGLPMPHFRYLRPRTDAGFKGTAAIIVEDPACNRGRGSIVGFGDGHYEWIPAPRSTALWAAIQERPVDHLWSPQESTTLPGLHE